MGWHFSGSKWTDSFDKDISGDDLNPDEIFNMNEDGSEQTQLTDNDADDEFLAGHLMVKR